MKVIDFRARGLVRILFNRISLISGLLNSGLTGWLARFAMALAPVFSFTSVQALDVIYDSGRTENIKKFYRVFQSPHRFVPRVYNGPMTISLSDRLPVSTPGMSPGPVSRRRHNVKGISRSVFILGTGARSRKWLRRNRDQLRKHQVIGIIVSARNAEEVRQIRSIAVGLKMHVLPVTQIVKRFRLRHYPVLISKGFIEQ